MRIFCTAILVFLIFLSFKSSAQNTTSPGFDFSNGIGIIAPDSTFSFHFRFRTQLRAAYNTISASNFSASEIEARVRRLRLRMQGFIVDPRLNYYIQLSFSRGDMDWEDNDNSEENSSPNVVRDAVVVYKPNPNLAITFGQTKLPGNRQRVVSSGELQFPDRSIVNSTFTIDRDFGLQFAYQNNISTIAYVLKGAISTGEGRNSVNSDAGLAYTGRLEILPLGKFTNKGDYFEGDLVRESTPKLSIAGGYHYNESAKRTAGTIGKDLYESRNLRSFIADALLKYNGFSLSTEFISRNTTSPITRNAQNEERVIYVGDGKMAQASYLFKNNVEIAGRYAIITPEKSIKDKVLEKEEMGLGITKYLRKHRVKIQGQFFYNKANDLSSIGGRTSNWSVFTQIELGL